MATKLASRDGVQFFFDRGVIEPPAVQARSSATGITAPAAGRPASDARERESVVVRCDDGRRVRFELPAGGRQPFESELVYVLRGRSETEEADVGLVDGFGRMLAFTDPAKHLTYRTEDRVMAWVRAIFFGQVLATVLLGPLAILLTLGYIVAVVVDRLAARRLAAFARQAAKAGYRPRAFASVSTARP